MEKPNNKTGIKALTLIRPWGHAIIYGPKKIENRSWKPPKTIRGKFIYIHSGQKYDKTAVNFMKRRGYNPPDEKSCPTGIIGLVEITGYVKQSESPWFVGPFGWTVGGVIAFLEPIKCPGKQGLWRPDISATGDIMKMFNGDWFYYL